MNNSDNNWAIYWVPIGKDPDAGRYWGQEEKGMTEDEMAGWHHPLDGRESEWTPGVGGGQGGLACCNSWSRKESDMTEQLNWTEYTHEQSENSPTKIKYNRLIWWTKEIKNYIYQLRTKLT